MKKKFYLTLDTETATLPFVNEIATTPKEKQTIAIAKPLVYDIGWTITDRAGSIIKRENFLVQETFFVPTIFNTAYYKAKRPLYIEKLEQGKITVKCWNDIVEILLSDLRQSDLSVAYNATFDYKKAIPFTERYIKHLYSNDYHKWEASQRKKCEAILRNGAKDKNEDFLNPLFELRGEKFPITDLWQVACNKLINNQKYKDFCLKNDFLTQSGLYFKTSAESAYAYLTKNSEFIEQHTALDDALIEAEILTKALRKGKVEPNIQAFPFTELGTTYEYVKVKTKYANVVYERVMEHFESFSTNSSYTTKLENILSSLYEIL